MTKTRIWTIKKPLNIIEMKKVNKPVKAYKGFNKHMQCAPNGKIFQYEIGKEYKEDEANLCHCGFHACENPLDVLSYYNKLMTNSAK